MPRDSRHCFAPFGFCGLSLFSELTLTAGRQKAAKTSADQAEGPPVGGGEEGPQRREMSRGTASPRLGFADLVYFLS